MLTYKKLIISLIIRGIKMEFILKDQSVQFTCAGEKYSKGKKVEF